MKYLFILLLFAPIPEHTDLLRAIKQVESSGQKNVKDGDRGRSKGSYQIQRAYFKDAVEQCPELRIYKYEDVRKDNVAVLIIRAYWKRYATKEWLGHEPTDRDRARLHNGGCHARRFQNKKKEATLVKYWAKVKAILDKKKLAK